MSGEALEVGLVLDALVVHVPLVLPPAVVLGVLPVLQHALRHLPFLPPHRHPHYHLLYVPDVVTQSRQSALPFPLPPYLGLGPRLPSLDPVIGHVLFIVDILCFDLLPFVLGFEGHFRLLLDVVDRVLGAGGVWLECARLHLSVFLLDSFLFVLSLPLHVVDDK